MIYKHADYLAILAHKKKKLSWRLRVITSMFKENMNNFEKKLEKRRKPRNYRRNRGFAVTEMARLSDPMFQRMFRLDRATFYELAERIDHIIQRNELKSIQSSGSSIPTDTRLAVTLRWLAGGSYLDLCFAWGVAVSTFFSDRGVLWPTIEALDDVLKLGFPLNDMQALHE